LIELPNKTYRIAVFPQEPAQKQYLSCNENGEMEIVCIDDHHSQSAAVNVKNGTSWYFDRVIPYGTKKRDFANQTATGAAVMGAFSISVVDEAKI